MKRPDAFVTAVQLDLETPGFKYRKWGATQVCKRHDWIVDNDGDVYIVDRASFENTYKKIGPGRYVKRAPVWAERAAVDGQIKTKEGVSHYKAGDYLVYNAATADDAYAVAKRKFEKMYRRADAT